MRGKRQGSFKPTRGGDKGGDDDSSRWLGTYGDAITLLMAFFVMLYSMSEVDADKFEAFIRGLESPFGNQAISEGLLDAGPSIVGEGADDAPGQFDQQALPELPVPVPAPPTDAASPADHEERPATDDIAQLEAVRVAILESLGEVGLSDYADFRYDGRGLVMSLATDNVLFASGSTEISGLGADLVAAVANALVGYDNDVFVEGHTDDVPLNRTGYTNWNLSTDRAVAVVTQLSGRHGLDQGRLGAAGYAEYRPRVPNGSDDNRAQNRRVDILIVAQGVKTNG